MIGDSLADVVRDQWMTVVDYGDRVFTLDAGTLLALAERYRRDALASGARTADILHREWRTGPWETVA